MKLEKVRILILTFDLGKPRYKQFQKTKSEEMMVASSVDNK